MLHFDFSEEPVWLDCKCGAKTNQVPCWDCRNTAEAATEKRYQDAIRDRSIPPRYAGATVADVATRVRGWDAAKVNRFTAFVKANPRQSITFVGESGAGKTTLATWALVNNPLYGVFVRASDLERARKEQALGKPAGLVETAEKAGVLLLDEVRTEGVAFGGTFDVLDYRHGRNLPTYSTTGLSDMKIGAALGDGAVRRLFEEPGVKVVRL
jgi:hypothetical protein